jgi:hypothetical protein
LCNDVFRGKRETGKIDEKETLKATEHDRYENIAGSLLLSLFMGSNGNAYYCRRRLARVEHNSVFTPINSKISTHTKRWYAYGGEHGTFNKAFRCSAAYGPHIIELVCPKRKKKTNGGTKQNRILTGGQRI